MDTGDAGKRNLVSESEGRGVDYRAGGMHAGRDCHITFGRDAERVASGIRACPAADSYRA